MTLKEMLICIALLTLLPTPSFAKVEITTALDNIFFADSASGINAASEAFTAIIIQQDKNGVSAEDIFKSVSLYVTQNIESGDLTSKEVSLTLALIEPLIKTGLAKENSARKNKSSDDTNSKIMVRGLILGALGGVVGWRAGKGNNSFTRLVQKLNNSKGPIITRDGHTIPGHTSLSFLLAAGPSTAVGYVASGIYAISNYLEIQQVDPYLLNPLIEKYDKLIDSK